MKKGALLNQSVSTVVAGMGHKDTITICDCGLPIPDETQRIDLALRKGIPTFLETLETVLGELCVEKVVIASEMKQMNTELYNKVIEIFRETEIEEISHDEFKRVSGSSKAIIRTGEYKPYANIILQSGVTF